MESLGLKAVWKRLPTGFRESSVAQLLRRVVLMALAEQPIKEVPDTTNVPKPQVRKSVLVTTIEELDVELKKADQAALVSDDEFRKCLSGFELRFDNSAPIDPFSKEYRDFQLALYKTVSGKDYKTDNESGTFHEAVKLQNLTERPFPYVTCSASTVGNQFIAIGHLIKTMNLPPKAKILEFGYGWGNTTIALGRMGYQVTAVEIDPIFVEMLNTRAKNEGCKDNISAHEGRFLDENRFGVDYDAVLFFESFHHCDDPVRMINMLKDMISQDGMIVFAGEPILEDFPYPWGLRMDGESLWAIRRNGWLELGFKESYFKSLLEKAGFVCTKHHMDATPLGTIYIAKKIIKQLGKS